MANTIFFSWQADTANRENRTLIANCLSDAIELLRQDGQLEEATRDLAADSDTKGVSGTPPIVDTIFRKIDRAAAFVADLTFVGKRLDGRPSPNPNVLIEYGWALKSLTYSRIVCIMNTAFGDPTVENLPFDMQHLRRPITYNCQAGSSAADKAVASKELTKNLVDALGAVLTSEEFTKTLPKPAAKAPFKPKPAIDGGGRFRSAEEPLGVVDSLSSGPRLKIFPERKPAAWLRVMPSIAHPSAWRIADLRNAATEPTISILPFSHKRYRNFDYVRGEDGFGIFIVNTPLMQHTAAFVYIFTSGEIWSSDFSLLDATKLGTSTPTVPIDPQQFSIALESYSAFLAKKLGVPRPHAWIAGMEDLAGRGIFTPDSASYGRPQGHCIKNLVETTGVINEGQAAQDALDPFFLDIHDACGLR